MKNQPKPENPKDTIGRTKLPIHLFPPAAIAFGVMGLVEGMLKYGRSNWRATPVYATVYYDALMRHMMAWMECEDQASDSGNMHLSNAMATLAIIIDAQTQGTLIDDRAYVAPGTAGFPGVMEMLKEQLAALKTLHADKTPHHYSKLDHARLQ